MSDFDRAKASHTLAGNEVLLQIRVAMKHSERCNVECLPIELQEAIADYLTAHERYLDAICALAEQKEGGAL